MADEHEGDEPVAPTDDVHAEMSGVLDDIEAALDRVAATLARMS